MKKLFKGACFFIIKPEKKLKTFFKMLAFSSYTLEKFKGLKKGGSFFNLHIKKIKKK